MRTHLPIMLSQSMPKRSVISTLWLAWLFRKDHQSLHSCWLLQNSFLDCPVSSVTSKPHTCRQHYVPQAASVMQRLQGAIAEHVSCLKRCSGLS